MDKTYLSAAEVAKQLVRPALKAAFPGVKFSVRSDSYAGGASIRVRWTDGPKRRAVDAVVDRFQGADFDGMRDMKVSRGSLHLHGPDGLRVVTSLADYIFAERDYSPDLYLQAACKVCRMFGEACPTREDLLIWTDKGRERVGGIRPDRDRWGYVRGAGEWLSTLVYRELERREEDEEDESATVAE